MPVGAVVIAVSVFLPAHLATNLGLDLTMIGSAWALVRIIDLVVDPSLGMLMDRTTTSRGRYKPWILLVGGPALMGGSWALFDAAPGISAAYLVAALLLLYLGQSTLMMGQAAWAANLATDYNSRSRTFGAISVATVLGGVLVLTVPLIGSFAGRTEAQGVVAMGWLIIAIAPATILPAIIKVPEPIPSVPDAPIRIGDLIRLLRRPELVRLFFAQLTLTLGPGWMSALFLFFVTASRGLNAQDASILLLVYIVAGIAGAVTLSRLALRIGKHRTLMVAAVGFAASVTLMALTPRGSILYQIPLALWAGFAAAGFDLTIRAMLADVADDVRLESGRDHLSLIYALNSLANKLAFALSIGITFPLLSFIGFDPGAGASNTREAIRDLELVFVAGPIIFALTGAACMIGWRLDANRHASIRWALDERDAANRRL